MHEEGPQRRELIAGCAGCSIAFDVENPDGTPFDLTDWAAFIRFRIGVGADQDRPMVVDDAPAGACSYTFEAGELTLGQMIAAGRFEKGEKVLWSKDRPRLRVRPPL
jgi:hypothetical protein